MAVSARTQAHGNYRYVEPMVTNQHLDFGQYGTEDYESVHYYDPHYCSRGGTNSKPRLLDGTTTIWRDPNIYGRGVVDRDLGRGTWECDHGWYTESISMPCEATDQKYDFRPYAFDNGYIIWSDELESEAIAKAIAKMKDMKAGIGEDLATARQTYSMLEESGRLLLNAALALKRGNLPGVWAALKDGRSAIQQGSNFFLQYKYGWKPLMSDIHGLTELLREQLKPAMLAKAEAKSQRESITPITDENYERSVTGPSYRSAKVVLWGQLDESVNRMGDRLGLSNPLSLGWELVPWSFVVDWFVPVGSTLDALTAPAGVKFLGGSVTMKGETSFTVRSIPPLGWIERSPRQNSVRMFSIRRQLYSDWPRAGFYAVNPFTSSHGQSAFALLIQKFKL